MSKWKNIRINEDFMETIKKFASVHDYKSYSSIAETAISEYMRKIDGEHLSRMLSMFRDDYTDNFWAYDKKGIKDFDDYIKYILLNKNEISRRAQYDKIMNDKMEEIKKFMIVLDKKISAKERRKK